jgi:hypothetical protein
MLPIHRNNRNKYYDSTVKNENTILPLYHISNSNGKLKKHKFIKPWNIIILTVIIMMYMTYFFKTTGFL